MPGRQINSKRDEVIRLHSIGQTYAEIGRNLGISRERARQISIMKPPVQPRHVESKQMLTTGDVARLIGVHDNTVRRWSQNGVLSFYRINPRGDRRFRKKDIDDFFKKASVGIT